MKNFIKHGKTLRWTAAADVVSGQLVKVGQYTVVCITDALTGEEAVGSTGGVYEYAKLAPEVIAVGDILYLNGSDEITKTDTGSLPVVGVAHKASASADTTGWVDIQQG